MSKTVLKFYSQGCGPCKVYAPVFEKIQNSEEFNKDITFRTVNVESDPENLTVDFKVKGVPCTIILDSTGKEVKRHSGKLTEEQLISFIQN